MEPITREREQELLAIFRDDDKMNEFLSNLTGEELKEYLAHINNTLIDPDRDPAGYGDSRTVLTVGAHVSPRLIVRTPFFDKLVETLNLIASRKEKAMLLYYLIHELHPFYDGNGRTARFLYNLLSDNKFDIQHSRDFKHLNGKKVSYIDFEQSKNFSDTQNAFHYASHFLRNYLVHFGILPDLYSNACTIITRTALYNDFVIDPTNFNRVYISDCAKDQGLSHNEASRILFYLLSNEAAFSVAGLSVAVLLSHLNVSESRQVHYIRRSNILSDTDNGISFWIDSKKGRSVSESIMQTWQREDYEKLIYFFDKIQEAIMETMLDIFEKPESFTIDTASSGPLPILDRLKRSDSDYYKDAPALINSHFTPDPTTRVYSRAKNLRLFLDMNCPVSVPPTTSTDKLWEQVASTLSTEGPSSPIKPLASKGENFHTKTDLRG